MTQSEIDALIQSQLGSDSGATINPQLAEAQANEAAAGAKDAANLNQNLIDVYDGAFRDYAADVLNGRVHAAGVPVPSAAFLALKRSDGWTYVVRGSDPVCPMRPTPQPPAPPPPLPQPANVRNVPLGDAMPVGYVLVAPDGSQWQKQASPTPFGMAYFYQRVG